MIRNLYNKIKDEFGVNNIPHWQRKNIVRSILEKYVLLKQECHYAKKKGILVVLFATIRMFGTLLLGSEQAFTAMNRQVVADVIARENDDNYY